jgi:hypothetical protein
MHLYVGISNISNFVPETGYSNLKKEAALSSQRSMLLCQSSLLQMSAADSSQMLILIQQIARRHRPVNSELL